MDHNASGELLLKLLALAERMEQRDARVIDGLAHEGAALRSAVEALQAGGQRFAGDALATLRAQGRQAVEAGVGEAVARCRERILQASAEAARAGETLRASSAALGRQRHWWAWSAPLALVVGSVLAVGAAGYAVVSSREQVARHRIEAALLRAYNRADVTLCGERLCANVEPGGERYGAQRQYRPVRPRRPDAP